MIEIIISKLSNQINNNAITISCFNIQAQFIILSITQEISTSSKGLNTHSCLLFIKNHHRLTMSCKDRQNYKIMQSVKRFKKYCPAFFPIQTLPSNTKSYFLNPSQCFGLKFVEIGKVMLTWGILKNVNQVSKVLYSVIREIFVMKFQIF